MSITQNKLDEFQITEECIFIFIYVYALLLLKLHEQL